MAPMRVLAASATAVLACPCWCGLFIGSFLGEKPMPDGRIGHVPIQDALAVIFGVVSLYSLVMVAALIANLRFTKLTPVTVALVRWSAITPVTVGIWALVVAAQNARDGEWVIATIGFLFGGPLLWLGYWFFKTPRTPSQDPEFTH